MLEMSRRGVRLHPLDNVNITVIDHITDEQLSNDIRLARKIVRRNVVGVRLSVEIPEKFLDYFRRRHGFLILTTRHGLPAGLVRSLLSIWKTNPYSLWLQENCPLKRYLKRHKPADFVSSVVSTEVAHVDEPASEPQDLGRVTYTAPREAREEDIAEEFGEEFLEFFRRLPN